MNWQCDKCNRYFDDGISPHLGFNFCEPASVELFAELIPKHLMNFAIAMTVLKKPVSVCCDCMIENKARKQ